VKLIPASEVSSDQLSEFFGRIPDGEQAFLKENIRDPETAAAWRGPGPARHEAAIDQGGTLVGVMSVTPELGWSDHVGQLRLLVDPAQPDEVLPYARELTEEQIATMLTANPRRFPRPRHYRDVRPCRVRGCGT